MRDRRSSWSAWLESDASPIAIDMEIQPAIKVEIEIQVNSDGNPGDLKTILKILERSGGLLIAHRLQRFVDRMTGFFICEKPAEAALALKRAGIPVETETVVTALIDDRPGMLSYLIQTLEAEGIELGSVYGAVHTKKFFIVLRSDDNARAEDILRNFLMLSKFTNPQQKSSPG